MGNRLMALVREFVGLSKPAELARIDQRIDDRELRLERIDAQAEAQTLGDIRNRKRRAGDR